MKKKNVGIMKQYEALEMLLGTEQRPFEFLEQLLVKCPTVAEYVEDNTRHTIRQAFEINSLELMEDMKYEAKQWARSAREDLAISEFYGE